jgi:hypothetical protein
VSGSHPEPPRDVATLRPLLHVVEPDHTWWRIHSVRFGPIHFGREPRNRFDAPAGEFGVLYVADDPRGAFVETFAHDTGRTPFVTESELRARALSKVRARRALALVDLRGPGLVHVGADAALTGIADYALTRRWAQAFFDHPSAPDGILYRARHDPEQLCAALFDRTKDDVESATLGTMMDPSNAPALAKILDEYHYGLI